MHGPLNVKFCYLSKRGMLMAVIIGQYSNSFRENHYISFHNTLMQNTITDFKTILTF